MSNPKTADSLRALIEHAIDSGINDVDSLIELIPNETLRARILDASRNNPVMGRKPTVDDLVKEILLLEEQEIGK